MRLGQRKPALERQHTQVSAEERSERLGQKGCTLWKTGLSASGKSTVGAAAARALELASPELSRRGIRSDLVVEDGAQAVHADPDGIGQVVANLIQNAARYTAGATDYFAPPDPGSVVVTSAGSGDPTCVGVSMSRSPIQRLPL